MFICTSKKQSSSKQETSEELSSTEKELEAKKAILAELQEKLANYGCLITLVSNLEKVTTVMVYGL